MKKKVLLTLIFFLCATVAFSFDEVKHLSLSAAGINTMEIDCGSGFLEVTGVDGLSEIKVDAEIVLKGFSDSDAKRIMDRCVKLSLERRGTRAVLISKIECSSMFDWGEKKIDLTVKVPKKMDLIVDDGSGSITIEDINGNLQIDDGSGSMEIKNTNGRLDIDDGSGTITLFKITGNIDIEDGSGTINIKSTTGDIDIDDGSGDIEAEDIGGKLDISDGSGSIDVRNVDGDVEVSDGSGNIYINGVEKNVFIKRDGSGSVSVQNVKGTVTMPDKK
jgi:hypothetical protein